MLDDFGHDPDERIIEVPPQVTAHALAFYLLELPDKPVHCFLNDFDLYNITHVSYSPGTNVEIDLGKR